MISWWFYLCVNFNHLEKFSFFSKTLFSPSQIEKQQERRSSRDRASAECSLRLVETEQAKRVRDLHDLEKRTENLSAEGEEQQDEQRVGAVPVDCDGTFASEREHCRLTSAAGERFDLTRLQT